MPSIVEDILSITDSILGIRDDIGAIKHHVYIVTRTWSGSELGSGIMTESEAQILPTPYVVDLTHKLALKDAGKVKEGDIMLKSVSKQSYATESLIDCSVTSKNEEKFYKINNKLYTVNSVTEDYVHWSVHISRTGKN